ncbi:RTA1-domain-containing protein [Westerdykella ornata]|uniref:RTA1-domain-containing protein n=1 Tax=Westerdykella ornata TaxID=318751 RepID=A0A6A6J5W6_WESOR|nr:RTA1-domain-containing protein [Westerdykella ornata]KAF2271971.1 RTA1-domain-containing protein [Westerdykella ornata]
MPELKPYKGSYYLWDYIPNLWAALAFAIVFTLLTAIHAWKMYRTRLWYCSLFVIGGVFEVIGYLFRIAARYDTSSLPLSILQSVFPLLAPILFAASLYMVYARVVRSLHAEFLSIVPSRWTTIIFVGGDWFCLNVQSSGAGLLGKPKNAKIAEAIIVAGLGLQILVFVAFMVLCSHFHVRYRRHEREKGCSQISEAVPWQAILNMLYGTSLLILVRNVFRMVEFIMGQDSYLFENEWPVYVFDGVLMGLVMAAFWWWFPEGLEEGGGGWEWIRKRWGWGRERVHSEDRMELRAREEGEVEDRR